MEINGKEYDVTILTESQRKAFILRKQGKTFSEIAKQLMMTIEGARRNYQRAVWAFKHYDREKEQHRIDMLPIDYPKRIVPLGNESAIFIDFGDNRIKEYDTSDLEMLDLGYASTIHKSQGSEYKSVIINLQCAHSIMLTRPLIYTAITRGKDKVTIVGERRAMCIAIKRTDTEKRGTCLAHRLQELDINERM